MLLVAAVVLFVDDDEAQPFEWREHGTASADDHTDAAFAGIAPSGQPFAVRQRRVQHGQSAAEAGPEPVDQLGRQANFGHQHQPLLAAGQHVFQQAQVHLGLAATGDAFQQEGMEPRARGGDGGERGGLRGGGLRAGGTRGRQHGNGAGFRGCGRVSLGQLGPAAFHGVAQGGTQRRRQRRVIRQRQSGAMRAQQFQRLALPFTQTGGRCGGALQRCATCASERPKAAVRLGRAPLAQQHRQSRREYFADGMVVIVRSPAQQAQGDRVQHGFRV